MSEVLAGREPVSQAVRPPLIELAGVEKIYRTGKVEFPALRGVDLEIADGEMVAIVGPSGSGKSTIMNMITGIDRPTEGGVQVAGKQIEKMTENELARFRGKNIGVIFQFFQLLPTLTVLENVILPMDFCRMWKPRERPERAMQLLEQMGLSDQAHKLPNTLSGGQQQRAAIARALANDPPLLMADEPTGNLDSKTADMVFTLFEDLVQHGKTFIMVTHDVELAKRMPRVIEVHDGILYEKGQVIPEG